ncbi:MAG: SurA N-terminal domain-containing protein [Kiritimatiellae bacterium]|nr:SurA N-terminal domain-containing protein [Kiritimatiellia bacterium]
MRYVNKFALFWAVALSFTAGCEKRGPGVYVGDRSRRIVEMSGRDVIVRVNGVDITKRDFDKMQAAYGMMYGLANGQGVDLSNPRIQRFLNGRGRATPQELMRRELMRQEAARVKLAANPEGVASAKAALVRSFRKSKVRTFEEAASCMGAEVTQYVEGLIVSDVQSKDLRKVLSPEAFKVSEKEIDEGLARVKRVQDGCAASNKIFRATIAAARAEVLAGRDFAEVAERSSRGGKGEALEWESLQIEEVPEESPLRAFLAKAKEGDISDVIEWEDGLMFVKVLKVGKGDEEGAGDGAKVFDLGRVVVNIWDSPDDMTRPEVRSELLKWKEQKAQEALGERLFKEAVLEFPNGTNWFAVATSGR